MYTYNIIKKQHVEIYDENDVGTSKHHNQGVLAPPGIRFLGEV
jgi:hypothetical protein